MIAAMPDHELWQAMRRARRTRDRLAREVSDALLADESADTAAMDDLVARYRTAARAHTDAVHAYRASL